MTIATEMLGRLFENLPALYREDAASAPAGELGRFLLPFAELLLGSGDLDEPGLEERIGGVHTESGPRIATGLQRYFDAGAPPDLRGPFPPPLPDECAPADFLPWLARWIALALREDWGEKRQRFLIGNAARLYRLRGTKRGLEELLAVYTSLQAAVEERQTPLQIDVHSRVGVDTLIDGAAPLVFYVKVKMQGKAIADLPAQYAIVKDLVDLQKPAHAHYRLEIEDVPIFRVGFSQVDVDTILG